MSPDDVLAIRVAFHSDVPAIANVHCAAALAAYADIFPKDTPKPTSNSVEPSWRVLIDDPRADVFVATLGDRLVGSAVLGPDENVPAQLFLKRLYVDPSHWRLGTGAALHDRVLVQADRRAADRLHLWVLERNQRARQMYQRRGWQLVPGRTLANEPPSVIDVLYQRPIHL